MQWIILLLIVSCIVIISQFVFCLIQKKAYKYLKIRCICLIIFMLVIVWYFTPFKLQLELVGDKRVSIPLKGGSVIRLNDVQKDKLIKILNQSYVKRDFFSGYRNAKYDAYNLITINAYDVNSEMEFVGNDPMAINLSLDENGFKYIYGKKSGYIEFIIDGQILDIQETDMLRTYVKQLISE